MYSYGPLHMAEQKQGDQLEPTYSSSVRIRVVALRTSQKRWTIRRGGERVSVIPVLMAGQNDEMMICLQTLKWFQVMLFNISNSTYHLFHSTMNNLVYFGFYKKNNNCTIQLLAGGIRVLITFLRVSLIIST